MTETQEAPPGVCPVHFDHYTQAFAADPWTTYTELRTTQPMAWSDQQGGSSRPSAGVVRSSV